MPKNRFVQLLGVAVFLFALYLFNSSGRTERSQEQQNYDQWLTHLEPRLMEFVDLLSEKNSKKTSSDATPSPNAESAQPVSPPFPLPKVFMNVSYGAAALGKSFKLSPQATVTDVRNLLRILQLIREADILSLRSTPTDPTAQNATVELQVQDDKSEFRSTFMNTDISQNPAALLLLRLIEEFSAQSSNANSPTEVVFDGTA